MWYVVRVTWIKHPTARCSGKTKRLYGVWSHTPWIGCPAVPQEAEGQVWCNWIPNEWSMTPYKKYICFSCYTMGLIIYDL